MTELSSGVRQALLDAAYDEVVSGAWAQTRMADVARTAGVSRQTLYNEFGSKDALAAALSARQTEQFLAGAQAVLSAGADDPLAAIRDSSVHILERAHDEPLVKAVLTSVHGGAGGDLLPFLTTRAEPVLAAAAAQLTAFLQRHWPHQPAPLCRSLAEAATRLIVSHVVLPTEPVETTADVVTLILSSTLGPAKGPTRVDL